MRVSYWGEVIQVVPIRIKLGGRLASSLMHHLSLYMKLVGIVWKCLLYRGLYMAVTAVYCDDNFSGMFYVDMEMVPEAVRAWFPDGVQVQLILSEDAFQCS